MLAPVIVVTGSRRSGTSMWMQVLASAGLPIIGDPFPLDWEDALSPVNPHGFYESTLRDGIHYGTNPDPRSGEYLHPDDTRLHAVKVFPEGLVRTDLAFFDRVLVTIRPWHEYAASMDRLLRVENERRGWSEADRPPRLPGAIEWWVANFSIIRDIAMRRYRVHLQTYTEVLAKPRVVVGRVLQWIAEGTPVQGMLDADAAATAVRPETATSKDAPREPLEPRLAEVFDAFYAAVAAGQGLPEALLARMNEIHEELGPKLSAHTEEVLRWLAERGKSAASVEPLALDAGPAPDR